jgi:hypothetical protein
MMNNNNALSHPLIGGQNSKISENLKPILDKILLDDPECIKKLENILKENNYSLSDKLIVKSLINTLINENKEIIESILKESEKIKQQTKINIKRQKLALIKKQKRIKKLRRKQRKH